MCHCLPARQHASTVCRMSEIHARAFKNRVASHTVLHHLRRTNLRVLETGAFCLFLCFVRASVTQPCRSLEPHHRSGYTAEASRSIVCTDLVECKPLFQACVPLQYKPILAVAYRLRAQAQRSDCRIVFSRKTLASTMYSPLPSMTTPTTTRTGRLHRMVCRTKLQ